MSLLVTGGAGFIGSNFVRRRCHSEPIIVLDALTYAGNMRALEGLPIDFVHGSICDGPLVDDTLQRFKVDRIIHFAAETHVDRSIQSPTLFGTTNLVGTIMLLDRAQKYNVKRFVQVSTDEVYGDLGPDEPPFVETSQVKPRSPYSGSKAGGDHMVQAYFETWGFPGMVTRCSNNYGPWQHQEKLIPHMIANALADRPLPVYGDGSNVRDWIHVDDHCAAIELVLERGRPGQIYNVGASSERTNLWMVKEILRLVGKPELLIEFVTDRPGHDRRYGVDWSKIQRELGWQPLVGLEEGLKQAVEWYRTYLAGAG